MAKIPLPQRGQPIDFTFIYQIADTINDIVNNISSSSNNINISTTQNAGTQQVSSSHLGIDATKQSIVDASQKQQYTFSTSFAYPPIVTITPESTDKKDAVVVIGQVTNASVDYYVTFPNSKTTKNNSINVYIQAIGIAQSIN
jgi:hypothetical protein